MSKKPLAVAFTLLCLLIATTIFVFYLSNNKGYATKAVQQNYETMQVYKSAACGCCSGYVTALKNAGFKVQVTNVDDIYPIKEKYGIPPSMYACHTTVMGKYFIEGHVPLEVVEKLLKQQPNIDGIALPGMPTGTPGMPGIKQSPLTIYKLQAGKYAEFTTI